MRRLDVANFVCQRMRKNLVDLINSALACGPALLWKRTEVAFFLLVFAKLKLATKAPHQGSLYSQLLSKQFFKATTYNLSNRRYFFSLKAAKSLFSRVDCVFNVYSRILKLNKQSLPFFLHSPFLGAV